MALGLLFFFGFLVFAVNVTYNLYATSVVNALALDAARDVAERNGPSAAQARADFLAEVGATGATLVLVEDGDVVRATLEFETNALFPQFSEDRAFGVIKRTFEVRVEEQQDS